MTNDDEILQYDYIIVTVTVQHCLLQCT